jgi:hypothetical protein
VMAKKRRKATSSWTITNEQDAVEPLITPVTVPAPAESALAANAASCKMGTKPLRSTKAGTLRSPLSTITLTSNDVERRHPPPDFSEQSQTHKAHLPPGNGTPILHQGEIVSAARQRDRRTNAPPAVPLIITAPTPIVNDAEFVRSILVYCLWS